MGTSSDVTTTRAVNHSTNVPLDDFTNDLIKDAIDYYNIPVPVPVSESLVHGGSPVYNWHRNSKREKNRRNRETGSDS